VLYATTETQDFYVVIFSPLPSLALKFTMPDFHVYCVNLQKSGRAQLGDGQQGERPPECKQQ